MLPRTIRSFAAACGAAALFASACTAPPAGSPGTPGGTPAGAATSASSTNDVAHNLALLDAYCWRLELNKNTDYTVLAKASEGTLADASVFEEGSSWAEVLDRTVRALEADMAAKGITPEEAMARNGQATFTEEQIRQLRERYDGIDAKAWYFKAVKTQGWTMTSKADIGGMSSVTAVAQAPTLIGALDESLKELDMQVERRKAR